MNPLIARFSLSLLTALVMSAASAVSVAADQMPAAAQPGGETRAAQRALGNQQAPSQSRPAAVPGSTPSASAPTSSAAPAVRRLFCLNMSLQCFALESATATSRVALDLRAPDIRQLVPEAELKRRLDDPYELREEQEQVQVEGTRPEVYVPEGIASLPWAVMHPTQAWRILLPVPSSQTK